MSRIRRETIRKAVAERARHVCEYCLCREDYSPVALSIEHVLPASKGGTDILDNLALSCQECNNYKFTKTEAMDPETGQVVPLYNPRQHGWSVHFAWNEDFTRIVGLTPTGRATVAALHLNRESLINLRQVLRQFGKHPLPETPD